MKYSILIIAAFLLTGCFKTHSQVRQVREAQELKGDVQESIASHGESLDRLQAQMGQLQGKIEELEHERRKELSQGLTSRKDSDQRFSELVERLEGMEKNQNLLFEEVKKMREENFLSSRSSREAPVKKKSIQNAYEEGLKAFRAKNYSAAAERFNVYIKESPRGKNILDAHYYAGEALFQEKDYAAAILALSLVQEKSFKSVLGRKATLRMAESFYALGKHKEARTFAQILVDTHPKTPEAGKAKRFLK